MPNPLDTEDKLIREINLNYPRLRIRKIRKVPRAGLSNHLLIGENSKGSFIIKFYRVADALRIKNEHEILNFVGSSNYKLLPKYVENKNNLNYTFSKKYKTFFEIYGYINGQTLSTALNRRNKLSASEIETVAKELRNMQVANFKKLPKKIKRPDTLARVSSNIKNLKRVLKVLNQRKKLDPLGITVRDVVKRKIKLFSTMKESALKDLRMISESRVGITHGDFSPTNLVFENGKIVAVLDWEDSGIDNQIWDLFRTMCLCSSIDKKKGLICSPLDLGKISIFLSSYFKNKSPLSKTDVDAFKLLPKYFYVFDPYIIVSSFLENRYGMKKFISKKMEDHFWLEENQNQITRMIEEYAGGD